MTTTKQKIIDAFRSGEILTSCSTAEQYLTADLRKIISDLRRDGLEIIDRWVISGTGKRYKEYYLKKEFKQLSLTEFLT